MADLYLTPAERYTAALGGFYYGDLPEPGTVYTQLIKDILNGATPDKEPKNILARFIYSLYISDLGDPYPRYELAKLLYWKLHDITPTKSGSILTVTIDGKEDYMTINTDLSRLWYKVLFGSKTDVITEFPYIFNTMQTKLSNWELFGNVSVSGTPTPDNQIMPEGTGERTGNLWNPNSRTNNQVEQLNWGVVLPAGTYTIKNDSNVTVYFRDGVDATTAQRFAKAGETVTKTTTEEMVAWCASSQSNIMLNRGSTALPYEPYGYKIPISSASTTTPVYLGEVETTRKIKKLVLTGNEDWSNVVGSGTSMKIFILLNSIADGLCNTFVFGDSNNIGEFDLINGAYLRFNVSGIATTKAEWVTYLQTQYAAGTPVTVWYVLATEETAVVNEPLMKIGNYADSMSRTQTGIDIPTVVGQNTLDVPTTVKPSSMRIEYTSAEETKSRSKRISLLKSPLKKGLIK